MQAAPRGEAAAASYFLLIRGEEEDEEVMRCIGQHAAIPRDRTQPPFFSQI